MMAKSKFVLALIGIAFLLLNPAGFCAGTPSTHAPAHPCCPAPSTSNHSSGTGACICIDRQPAAPTVPLADGQFVSIAAVDKSLPATAFGNDAIPVHDRAGFTHEARFLNFHQILV